MATLGSLVPATHAFDHAKVAWPYWNIAINLFLGAEVYMNYVFVRLVMRCIALKIL